MSEEQGGQAGQVRMTAQLISLRVLYMPGTVLMSSHRPTYLSLGNAL